MVKDKVNVDLDKNEQSIPEAWELSLVQTERSPTLDIRWKWLNFIAHIFFRYKSQRIRPV